MFRKIFSTNIGKITIITTSLILMGMITMGSTYAFYHQEKVLTNTFTVGKITTEIIEDFDQNGEKAPQVKNTDVTDCIVRMRYDISPDNAPIEVGSINEEYWGKIGEFYYYKDVLKAGETTEPLFENYTINTGNASQYVNEYGNKFQIILYQEAVQAEMVDNETTIKAFDENGNYVWANHAEEIWKCYDGNNP